jgi:hypothetical protein
VEDGAGDRRGQVERSSDGHRAAERGPRTILVAIALQVSPAPATPRGRSPQLPPIAVRLLTQRLATLIEAFTFVATLN